MKNRLSAGITTLDSVDVSYMVDGMTDCEIVELNTDQTIDFWIHQHNEHDNDPLEKWEIDEARKSLIGLVELTRRN